MKYANELFFAVTAIIFWGLAIGSTFNSNKEDYPARGILVCGAMFVIESPASQPSSYKPSAQRNSTD